MFNNTVWKMLDVYHSYRHTLSLVPKQCDDDRDCSRSAIKAGKRFLRAGASLTDDEVLGLQIGLDSGCRWTMTMFSDSKIKMRNEDAEWIFKDCAFVKTGRSEVSDSFNGKRRMKYVLAFSDNDEDLDDHYSRQQYEEMFEMLKEADASVRIVTGLMPEDRKRKGMIMISLPEEISLRLRSMITMTISQVTLIGLDELYGYDNDRWLLDRKFIQNELGSMIYALMYEESPEIDEDPLIIEDEFDCDIDITDDNYEHGTGSDPMSQLDGLVGIREVKEQVKKIAAYGRMKKDMEHISDKKHMEMSLNMEFVGNPGTAKTTVARILAGILNEVGLISDSRPVEVGRADLVGMYVGQTADKVKELFRKAKGRLLFIDEAYSLVERDRNSFGDEAINTIVQEMENNRDTIVIFAGYPDRMKELFSRNPGLRSRVPFTIRFNDYSAAELEQISELEAGKRGFSVAPEARERLEAICGAAADMPDFGNGRFCRNLMENAILEYAVRVYSGNEGPAFSDFMLTEADLKLPVMPEPEKKVVEMGFHLY